MPRTDVVPFDRNPLLLAKELIQSICVRLKSHGCNSATVVVRDPLLPYYWRTVADYGVKYREFLHGPLSAESAVGELIVVDDDDWVGPHRIDRLSAHSAELPLQPLYGSFAQRENVKSAAVLRFSINGDTSACVFVNFDRELDSATGVILNAISAFRKRFQKVVPALLRQLSSQVPSRIRRIRTLHMAAKHFPAGTVGASAARGFMNIAMTTGT